MSDSQPVFVTAIGLFVLAGLIYYLRVYLPSMVVRMRVRVIRKGKLTTKDAEGFGSTTTYHVETDKGVTRTSEGEYDTLVEGKTYEVYGTKKTFLGDLFTKGPWRPLKAQGQNIGPALTANASRALLEALCCVMMSDGKIAKQEKAVIVKALADVKAPLTSEEIESYIADFVLRVRTVGFRRVLNDAVERLSTSAAQIGSKRMFLQSLSNVAKADGEVADKERRVVEEFWTVLESN